MLTQVFSTLWWLTLLRGVAAILFGVFALMSPGTTLAVLLTFVAAWFVVDGVFTIIQALRARGGTQHWWLMLLEGVFGVAFGALAMGNPGVTALVLLFWIAAWAIVSGVARIGLAIRLREEIEGEFWLGLGGVISMLFGFLLMARPGEGALAVLFTIGLLAIAHGIVLLVFAFKARGMAKRLGAAAAELKAAAKLPS